MDSVIERSGFRRFELASQARIGSCSTRVVFGAKSQAKSGYTNLTSRTGGASRFGQREDIVADVVRRNKALVAYVTRQASPNIRSAPLHWCVGLGCPGEAPRPAAFGKWLCI